MRRFGALFGLILGAAGALNGIFLILFAERALPEGRRRFPAFHSAIDFLGPNVGPIAEGLVSLVLGLGVAAISVDLVHPFLSGKASTPSPSPPRDVVRERFASIANRLTRLTGWRLSLTVAVPVAAAAWLLLN